MPFDLLLLNSFFFDFFLADFFMSFAAALSFLFGLFFEFSFFLKFLFITGDLEEIGFANLRDFGMPRNSSVSSSASSTFTS